MVESSVLRLQLSNTRYHTKHQVNWKSRVCNEIIHVDSQNPYFECYYQNVLYSKEDHSLVVAPANVTGNIVIPMTCETIHSYAYTYWMAAKVTINSGVTIHENAFSSSNVGEFIFDASFASVPTGCFSNQENLKTFKFKPGSKVQILLTKAFSNCPVLVTINLEELTGLSRIGNRCFKSWK